MKLKHAVVVAAVLGVAPMSAMAAKKATTKAAAPVAAKPVIPTLDAVLGASGINLSGTVDMSYDVSKNDVGGTVAGTGSARAFDVHPNSFVFHQLNLTVSKRWDNGLSLVVNPIFGDDANRLQGTRGQGAALGSSDWVLNQAYLAYSLGNLTLMGGKFVTLAGSEVINPAGNINASRSFLFANLQPLTHVGVRGTYELVKGLTLTVGGLNSGATASTLVQTATSIGAGAGNANTDNNSEISIESQIAYTGGMFSSALTYYTGAEGTAVFSTGAATLGSDNRQVDLYDLTASVTPIDALTLGLNADIRVTDANATGGPAAANGDNKVYDSGIAGYVNFKLTPKARIALRGEYFSIDSNTPNAAAGGEEFIFGNEITATFGYAPISGLELLAEVRHDNLSGNLNAAGANTGANSGALFPAIDPSTRSSYYQQTGTLKAIYRF